MSTNLVQWYNSDGSSPISSFNLADINAGVTDTPKKYGFQAIGGRTLNSIVAEIQNAIVGNDGDTELRIAGDTNGTIGPPTSVVAVVGAAGGVWGSGGTKGLRIAAINATGETIAQQEITFFVSDTSKEWNYSWDVVATATGYKLYRTDIPGTYGASSLRTTIGSGATNTFVDDGSATGAGQPATANTTGGAGPAYGTPPPDINFGIAALAVGNMTNLAFFFLWARRVVTAGTPETGNPRIAFLAARETA